MSDNSGFKTRGGNESLRSILPWIRLGVFVVLVSILLFSVVRILPPIFQGNANSDVYTSTITAIATVLLVLVTQEYVRQTKRLVKKTQEQAASRWERWFTEQQEKKNRVRHALSAEVGQPNWAEWEDPDGEDLTSFPTESLCQAKVYEENIGKIGLLTSNEQELLFHYYHQIHKLKNRVSDYKAAIANDDEEQAKQLEFDLVAIIRTLNNEQERVLEALSDKEDTYESPIDVDDRDFVVSLDEETAK